MKIYITFTLTILCTYVIWTGCSDSDAVVGAGDEVTNTSWVFVANEGDYGATNGSISMIDEFGNVY